MKTKPPPGSPEAVALGCRCAVYDNHHGKGYMGIEGVYVYSGACKLHAQEMQQKEQELDDDLNEPLGTAACNLDGECESCQ